MYYESDDLLLVELEKDVKEFLSVASEAHMATHSRSKSFKILQHLKKHFPHCTIERKFNDDVYLISIRENYETV